MIVKHLYFDALQQSHVLAAGCTGSGKSVLLDNLIYSHFSALDAAAVLLFQNAHDAELRRVLSRFGKAEEADCIFAVERGKKRLLGTLFDVFLARLRDAEPVGQRF